jgi:hypothetical protein
MGSGKGKSRRAQLITSGIVADPEEPVGEETKEAIEDARNWLVEHLRADGVLLADGHDFENLPALSHVLPSCFSRFYSQGLVEKFVEVTERVAAKLGEYPDTYLESVAEELAAYALIREAVNWVDSGPGGAWAVSVEAELRRLREIVLGKHSTLLLFDPGFDGVDNSGNIPGALGAENLSVWDWFTPFYPYKY